MSTDVEIANAALTLLGAQDISSTGLTAPARGIEKTVSNRYERTVRTILAMEPGWRCTLAIKESVSVDGGAPTGPFTNGYALPSDLLIGPMRVFSSGDVEQTSDTFAVRNTHIYTELSSSIKISYIKRADTDEWPPHIETLITLALAADLAIPVTDQEGNHDRYFERAFGLPSEKGQGGAYGAAVNIEAQAAFAFGSSRRKLRIINEALQTGGLPPIFSVDDPTRRALDALSQYNHILDDLIGRYRWAESKAFASLTADPTVTDAIVAKWSNAYDLPDDMVGQPVAVYANASVYANPISEWEISGGHMLCNLPTTCIIQYRKRPSAESAWSSQFRDVFIHALAARIAPPEMRPDLHAIAFGAPHENGRGGLIAQAIASQAIDRPHPNVLIGGNPITDGRFAY